MVTCHKGFKLINMKVLLFFVILEQNSAFSHIPNELSPAMFEVYLFI